MNEVEELKKRIRELEAGAEEPIVRGHKKVIEIIARGKKYFCQSMQEKMIFSQNNPGVKVEVYNIELPKFLADRYLKENKKHFITQKSIPVDTVVFDEVGPMDGNVKESEDPTADLSDLTVEEPMWRHQAARLGIPYKNRTKEDVLAEIEKATTVSTA